MFFYVYKVTDPNTGEFYIGSRGCECNPEEDKNYKGSMVTWKPDKNILIKDIIKSDFKSRKEAIKYEADIIKEYFNDELNRNYNTPDNYLNFYNDNMATVYDENGRCIKVSTNDPKYINGEYKHITKNMVVVKDLNGENILISKNDPRYLSGELKSVNTGKLLMKDKDGNKYYLHKSDPRYLSGELMAYTTGLPSKLRGREGCRKGKPVSKEQKVKQSLSMKGKNTKKVICLNNNIIYNSVKEASDYLNVNMTGLSLVLNGKKDNVKGLIFKYVLSD